MLQNSFTRFRDIEFGNCSAEVESAKSPQLLLEGYLDASNVTRLAISGDAFLFLGYKGSGKTALGKRLLLLASQQPQLFVRTLFLADLTYPMFLNMVGSDDEASHAIAWSWLLITTLIDSLEDDQGANRTPEYDRAIRALNRARILPARDLPQLVGASATRSIKLSLPFDFGLETESGSSFDTNEFLFAHVGDILRRLLAGVRTSSRHILVIDGLDDILSKNAYQYHSLMALINSAMRLNLFFRETQLPLKVLVLCRTDIFERLTGPNKNKIRQDFAYEFDWYDDPTQPDYSELVRLVNLRSQVTFPQLSDVFATFFPPDIDGVPICQFLLNETRYTPRDILQLLKHIQKYDGSERLTDRQVLNGLRDYSVDYLMPEIRDELAGYFNSDPIEALIRSFSALQQRQFFIDDLLQSYAGRMLETCFVDVSDVFNALYECGVVGQIRARAPNVNHYIFKYHSRQSAFNPEDMVVLHRGLWFALDLV